MTKSSSGAHDQAAHVQIYLMVFGALTVFTIVTVLVSWLHLPKAVGIPLGLAIATVKAGLVAAFFMHLKWERTLIYGLLCLTLFFTVFLFTLPMLDTAGNSDRVNPTATIEFEAPETQH